MDVCDVRSSRHRTIATSQCHIIALCPSICLISNAYVCDANIVPSHDHRSQHSIVFRHTLNHKWRCLRCDRAIAHRTIAPSAIWFVMLHVCDVIQSQSHHRISHITISHVAMFFVCTTDPPSRWSSMADCDMVLTRTSRIWFPLLICFISLFYVFFFPPCHIKRKGPRACVM